MKKVLKILGCLIGIIVVIAIIGAVIVFAGYNKAVNEPASSSSDIVEFTIEEGETVQQISQNLEEAELVKNGFYFQIYLMLEDLDSMIQAGQFRIPKNLNMKELAETLQNAKVPDVWVTIPEGLMATEIADIVQDGFSINPESSFSKEEFLNYVQSPFQLDSLDIPVPDDKPLEGYLFPDTYRFPSDATTEYVLTTIISDGFRKKIYEKYLQDIENSEYSLYEILTIASILERETRHPEDRPIVADILIRRLENNWRLEVDATLLYYFGDWTHEITYQDLQLDTPYNTRKVWGLTPTPICNPGENTIKAVLNPEPNDYWFYVSDSDGVLHYAVTIEEHNQNIAIYVQ